MVYDRFGDRARHGRPRGPEQGRLREPTSKTALVNILEKILGPRHPALQEPVQRARARARPGRPARPGRREDRPRPGRPGRPGGQVAHRPGRQRPGADARARRACSSAWPTASWPPTSPSTRSRPKPARPTPGPGSSRSIFTVAKGRIDPPQGRRGHRRHGQEDRRDQPRAAAGPGLARRVVGAFLLFSLLLTALWFYLLSLHPIRTAWKYFLMAGLTLSLALLLYRLGVVSGRSGQPQRPLLPVPERREHRLRHPLPVRRPALRLPDDQRRGPDLRRPQQPAGRLPARAAISSWRSSA